jgi:uncharacterized membrane protein YjgN (DUF898 family)
METRIKFTGTGGGLLVKFLVGMILSAITLGIYVPWFVVNLTKYIYEHTTLETPKGAVSLSFSGTGGQFFLMYIVGVILTMITLGIYIPWFITKFIRFFVDHSTGTGQQGEPYQLHYQGTGGGLFVTFIVGYILTVITLGIYTPWFICKVNAYLLGETRLMTGEVHLGELAFTGTGGNLFVTFLVGYLLTIITIGIYGAWFAVKLIRFNVQGTQIKIADQVWSGDFDGTGGQLLVLFLVGYILTFLTLGIYGAWFTCNLLRFHFDNTRLKPVA